MKETKPYKILFVCMGNICRSPTAEGIMNHLIEEEGLQAFIQTDSAGTYGGHAGELPDTRMRQHASRRGYHLTHRSRRITLEDFELFDLILVMDDNNMDALQRMVLDIESARKVERMTDYCRQLNTDHVPDPYYGGSKGFENVMDILEDACAGLLQEVKIRIKD